MIKDNILKQLETVGGSSTKNESFFRPLGTDERNKMSIKSPKGINNLFLYNLRLDEYLDFPIIPETLSAAYTSSMVKATPIAVLHPINFYIGGSAKTISFNFDMHEDINGLENNLEEASIYTTLDVLKRMSEPVVENNNVVGPSVYLQLGTQFAGKGHIQTSISMKAPFRKGRYLLASVSLEFTFHEEFKQDYGEMLSDSFNVDTLGVGYNPEELFGDQYNNWIKESQYDYEFVIQNTFGDKKLAELLKGGNYAINYYYGEDSLKDPSLLDLTKITTEGYTRDYQKTYEFLPTSAHLEDTIYSKGPSYARPYTEDLATYYYLELIAIINPTYTLSNKIENLITLKNKVIKLQNYIKTDPKYKKHVIKGSETKPLPLKKANDILARLIIIIESQLTSLKILYGASN